MGFREREEYRDWRAQVLGLFGSQCVICQHSGNLHIHHIKPVQTYPELAFEPSNGVPLCGNCHAQVTGREEEFEDELQRRQARLLNTNHDAKDAETVVLAPENNISNANALRQWMLDSPDRIAAAEFCHLYKDAIAKTRGTCTSLIIYLYWNAEKNPLKIAYMDVVRFYRENRTKIDDAPFVYALMADALTQLDGFDDAIIFIELGMKRAKETHDQSSDLPSVAACLARKLRDHGRTERAVALIKGVLAFEPCLPEYYFSVCHSFYAIHLITEGLDPSQAEIHLLKSTSMEYGYDALMDACQVVERECEKDDRTKAKCNRLMLTLYNKTAELAENDRDRIVAIRNIASLYRFNDLYDEAIQQYKRIISIDNTNSHAMGWIAWCFQMKDNTTAAREMARKCLFLDPDNEHAKGVLRDSAET